VNKEDVDAVPTRARYSIGKRRAIMGAAAELFLADGYGQVSMDRIAQTAGVSKQTVYSHFQSKEALFEALVTERCDEMLSLVPEPLDRSRKVEDILRHLGRNFLRLVLSEDALMLYRTVVAEAGRFPELGVAFYSAGPKRSHTRLANWLEKETREGRLRVDDPQMAAEQFFGMVKGDVYAKGLLGAVTVVESIDIDRVVDSAVRVFLKAYGVPEGD
jgi:TetR/AcrR family transcriptional repressor of mexJK operon